MSKTRKSTKSDVNTISSHTSKKVENTWILLGSEKLFKNDNFSIIKLPHPSHGNLANYCLDDVNNCMYEVVTFKEPYRSWFINDTVKSDSSISILSPMDPTYLVLPLLREQCESRAIPLEDLLSDKLFTKITDFITDLSHVADSKGPPVLKAYKYNEDKTLTWLESKVRKLSDVLKKKNIHVRAGAVSTTFVTSKKEDDVVEEEFYLKYAHGLVSEYLQEELAATLEKRFDFKPELVEQLSKKRKSEAATDSESKKVKCEIDCKENSALNGFPTVTPQKKEKPLTAKEKTRLKAASGTKTISSFFTKK